VRSGEAVRLTPLLARAPYPPLHPPPPPRPAPPPCYCWPCPQSRTDWKKRTFSLCDDRLAYYDTAEPADVTLVRALAAGGYPGINVADGPMPTPKGTFDLHRDSRVAVMANGEQVPP
jgi:hypothetical protein